MTHQDLDRFSQTRNPRPSEQVVTISTLSDSGTLSLSQYRELCKVASGPFGFGRGRVTEVAQFLVDAGFGNRLAKYTQILELYFSEAVSIRSPYCWPSAESTTSHTTPGSTSRNAGAMEQEESPPYVLVEERKAEIDRIISEALRQIKDELSPVWKQANRHAPLAPELAAEVKTACSKRGLRSLAVTAVIGLGILGAKEVWAQHAAQSSATPIDLKSATLPATPK